MYTSWQCMYYNLRQWTVPMIELRYGYQFFEWQTTMMKDTCSSIDENDMDTDFSRSKQQWREPLVALLMITKMRTSSTVNTRTTYQWKQVDSVCTHTPSRFEATDSSNKQMTIWISNFSYEQTTMNRALCFGSLDGIKDAVKFNSNTRTVCQMQKQAIKIWNSN